MRRVTALVLTGVLVLGIGPLGVPMPPPVSVSRAQDGPCATESEPNDTPDGLPFLTGPVCLEGALPQGDQDLLPWELSEADAARPWTITLDGIEGTLTALKILPITSEAGVSPMVAGSMLLEVAATPDAPGGRATRHDTLLPAGRLLLGISRSAMADGSEPVEAGYRLSLMPGDPLPSPTESEPNDDDSSATPLAGQFAIRGDARGGRDIVAWTVDPTRPGSSWTVSLNATVGAGLALTLRDPTGTDVAFVYQDTAGRAVFPDLEPVAGTWSLVIVGGGDRPVPYALEAALETRAADPEPNDLPASAVPVEPTAAPVRGRLFPLGDRDRYRITIVPEAAPMLRDLKLLGGDERRRTLCLGLLDGRDLQCRDGVGALALTALALSPGEYLVTVAGDPDAARGYVLRLDPTAVAVPDFEAEPNDEPAVATPFDPGTVMRGLGSDVDSDVYRLRVSGDAQLWEVRVTGTDIGRLAWIRRDWTQLGEAWVEPGGATATLTDLYLVPGEHWFRLHGGGDYRITATPLGPPDPDGEREPNGTASFAQPYRLGRTHLVGRLPSPVDVDVLRFSLAGTERVSLVAEPPADGSIDLFLMTTGELLSRARPVGPGLPSRLDLLLEPGDYEVWLQPGEPSQDRYRFHIERGDPFHTLADQEPNDRIEQARPLAGTLDAAGTLPPGDSPDWYALPPVAPGVPIRVTFTGGVSDAVLSDGLTELPVAWDDTALAMTADGTSGLEPRFLGVFGSGDYTLAVRAVGLLPLPPAAPPEVDIAFTLDAEAVAAYWPAAQRLHGTLTLVNPGSDSLDVVLDAVTSHVAWTATPVETAVTLGAGETRTVAVEVLAGADAWADEPVRITVRVRNALGGAVTAATVVTPRGDADPVAPELGWAVPGALLGGLDVASSALGALAVPTYDQAMEDSLHDGFTHTGTGFSTARTSLPVTLTVDLAGDLPVPVAGFALNPQADEAYAGDVPRDVELLLSVDGATFQPAASVRMTSLMADQWFVLAAPVPATHARIRITSAHGAGFGQVILGEWKVIASPGVTPTAGALDIAAPARGGHVAWMDPQPSDEGVGPAWLDAAPAFYQLFLPAGTSVSWAIGFRNGRAAQVTALEWVDPVPSTDGQQFEKLTVDVAIDGPAGPWTSVGTWALERAADGTVAPFTFPAPTWVRFVRLTGQGPRKQAGYWDPPSGIRALERPTDAPYRSILGEWGADGRAGPMEWLEPPDLSLPPVVVDADDTPETAGPIVAGTPAVGRVDGRTDVDWYAFSVPEGHNSLELQVAGKPLVAVALTLTDTEGFEVPMLFRAGDAPGTVLYEAEVTPGAAYRLKVEQPPSSIVFTFDTSGSMGGYLDYVYQAMRAFTADVTPGEEFVSVVPFEEQPLLPDWSDDPFLLQDAVGRFVSLGGSSSAETALITAATALSAREGAKAVLMVTDAETSSFGRATELWQMLASVRPLVFAVHVGAAYAPPISTAYMQDWAGVAGGFYQYTRTHGEMDRAFDRLATWLRRPAAYRLDLATSFQEEPPPSAEPGRISVASPADGSSSLSPDVGVEIILDTSGSMLKEIRDRPRIALAKDVLTDLVTNRLPAGAPVAVRVLGDAADVCGTRLVVPLGPLDAAAAVDRVAGIEVVQEADTPLGQALRAVPDDLAGSTGTRIVLLITDSEEVWPHPDLCGEDPAAAIRDLRRRGIDARLNIVGLEVDARKATAQLRRWARLGNGTFFSAKDAAALGRSIRTAVSAPFRILDAQGNEVASGTVDGAEVPVRPGVYSVVVLTDPVARFDGVEVEPGGGEALQLPDATPPPSLEPVATAAP